jgi:hypothetical protein
MVEGASVRRLRSRSLVRAGGGEVGGGGWWEGKRQDGVTNRRRIFIKFFLGRRNLHSGDHRWPITAHNAINVPGQLRRSNGPQPQHRISYWRQGFMLQFEYISKIRKKHVSDVSFEYLSFPSRKSKFARDKLASPAYVRHFIAG